MYRPTEIETTARRTSIGHVRPGLLSPRTQEVTLGCRIGGSNKRLLVEIDSETAEAQCLEFARRFANGSGAEGAVIKPVSADPALAEEATPKRLRGRNAVRLGLPLFEAAIRTARELQSHLIVLVMPTWRWSAYERIDVGIERILCCTICPVICISDRDVRGGAAPNRELSAASLRDRHESWLMQRRPEGRDPAPIFVRGNGETGVEISIVTINNTNIYDSYETEIACSG